jgi:hypothetical protein
MGQPAELWSTVLALNVVAYPIVEPGLQARTIVDTAPTDSATNATNSTLPHLAPAGLPTGQATGLASTGTQDASNSESPSSEGGIRLSDAARFALTAGARGGADGLASARLEGLAALSSARAEIGITAAYEPNYNRMSGASGAQHGLVAGIILARRTPLWGNTALLGAQAQLAVMGGGDAQDRAEARLGTYAGMVFPPGTLPFALRTTLAFDVLPADIGRSPSTSDAASSPWWALSVGVGVEFGGA